MAAHYATTPNRATPMTDRAIIDTLAQALPALTHPGDGSGSIQLPTAAFRAHTNLPPEVAEQFAQEAGLPTADMPKLFAEAIIHTIEAAGIELIPTAELAALRAAAPQPAAPYRQVEYHCYCGTRLFAAQVRDANTDKPKLPGPQLIKALTTLNPECAQGHR